MRRRRIVRRLLPLLAAGAIIAALIATSAPKAEPDPVGGALPAAAKGGSGGDVEAAAPALEAKNKPKPRPRPASRAHRARPDRPRSHRIDWRHSRAIGEPESGSLKRGVMLPSEGVDWVSWDPVEKEKPDRWWRRWGTDRLVRTTLGVIRDYAADHPNAPLIAIGDLSRPHGGDFGTDYGPIGHASHQNGLDVDVYYPRIDRRERPPLRPDQVDVKLSQDLVDRFVAAGAEKVFVGPNLPLNGPPGVVVPLVNHDNHLHFRLPGD